jgi:hypothetical protein
MMNPFAGHLVGNDPLQVIVGTPERVRVLMKTIGKECAERRPAPGTWCAREIVCHLADCEAAFAVQLRQALTEGAPALQPFDQEKWSQRYRGYSLSDALAVFAALRQWNLVLVRSVGTADSAHQTADPERGGTTFATLVETMGGHDLSHLKQLEAIAAEALAA